MSDLLTAAKAVIAEWDDRQVVGDRKLRAAVERAEKQEAVGFEEWAQSNVLICDPEEPDEVAIGVSIWTAAQQAERERIKQIIVYEFSDLVSDLSGVMEMIDGR